MSKIILLSYPRSGNTWVRYILEFLSKRPTQGYDHKTDVPLGARTNIGVDLKAPPIAVKSHRELGGKDDKLLVIVRDYREAITRHAKAGEHKTPEKMKKHFIQETGGKEHKGVDYITVIQTYEEFEGDKLLVYYEDLINKPTEQVERIIEFAGIDKRFLTEFLHNYEKHKAASLGAYSPGSHTKGTNLKHHSSALSSEFVSFMTAHVKKAHPELFDKYLKKYV